MRSILLVALAALVVGCATQQKMTWVRTDGQSGRANPALAQQFEVDKTICTGETQKANMSATPNYNAGGVIGAIQAGVERNNQNTDVAKGCMAQRGYMYVPADQAEATAASYRAAAVAAKSH